MKIVLTGRLIEFAMDKLSGSKSRKETAIQVPAAEAKKYGREALNFKIIKPPIRVETKVARAKRRTIEFIFMIREVYF